ncbi:hypothetical protein Ciccas_001342 [Cichlidogyrus casuarinus]|uniref:Uncharacterized protein n=1 Tax=Cichlidogyrus casuarinus TaxID=1844966 RepID=A0ABD2QKF7_9PLAT
MVRKTTKITYVSFVTTYRIETRDNATSYEQEQEVTVETKPAMMLINTTIDLGFHWLDLDIFQWRHFDPICLDPFNEQQAVASRPRLYATKKIGELRGGERKDFPISWFRSKGIHELV